MMATSCSRLVAAWMLQILLLVAASSWASPMSRRSAPSAPPPDPYVCAAFCPQTGVMPPQESSPHESNLIGDETGGTTEDEANGIGRMAKREFAPPGMCNECAALYGAGKELQDNTGLHYNEYFDYQNDYYQDESPMMDLLLKQLVAEEMAGAAHKENRSKKLN